MAQRIKGQECQVVVTAGGELRDEMDAILNFNFTQKSEIKSQGYLGEKSERKDDVFMGVASDMELHISKQDIFRFAKLVKQRQTRELPDLVFNISMVMQFSNGDTPTVTIPDLKFGEIPFNIGGRTEYVKVKLTAETEDFDVILS